MEIKHLPNAYPADVVGVGEIGLEGAAIIVIGAVVVRVMLPSTKDSHAIIADVDIVTNPDLVFKLTARRCWKNEE